MTHRHALLCVVAVFSFQSGLVQASEAVASSEATSNAAPATELEGIVVTAQRRAEREQDVPITITQISVETMKQANITDLSDLVKVTPGASFDDTLAYISPTLRGVGTSIFVPGGGTNVGIYVDGFYSPAPASQDFELMNVDNIEVLKGPQGTLFGRNTTGGAILVNTAKPSTDTTVIAEASYGSYNAQKYQVYATTGLTDKIAVDIAGQLSKGDGWVTNLYSHNPDAGAYDNYNVRAGISYQVTDDLSLLFRYEHSRLNDPTSLLSNEGFFVNGHSATLASSLAGNILATRPGQISESVPLINNDVTDAYQLTGNLDMGFAGLTSYTQFRSDTDLMYYSLDYSNLALASLYTLDHSREVTQELLLNSKPGSRLQYTGGLFYFDWHEGYEPAGFAPGGVQNPPTPYPEYVVASVDSKSIAGYGDATYQVGDNLFLTGGLRYTHDEVLNAYQYFVGGVAVFPPNMSTNNVTPRGVVRYQLNNESSVYASVSEGYKAAIYNVTAGGAGAATPILPEKIRAYEVGYKYAAQAFAVNLASFFYNYTNEQVQTARLVSGAPLPLILNAAASHIYGIDADSRYQFNKNFSVNVAAEWLHARYTNFPLASSLEFPSLAGTFTNASGLALERAPNFSGNVGAAYTTPIAGGKFVLSGNAYYTTKYYMDLADQIPQGAYATLDARAEWTDPSDRWTLAVAGKNLTDREYLKSIFQAAGLGIGAVWAAPREIEGSVRVKF